MDVDQIDVNVDFREFDKAGERYLKDYPFVPVKMEALKNAAPKIKGFVTEHGKLQNIWEDPMSYVRGYRTPLG